MTLRWTKWKLECPNCHKTGSMTLVEKTELTRTTTTLTDLSYEFTYVSTGRLFEQGQLKCRNCYERTPVLEQTNYGEGDAPAPLATASLHADD